MLGIKKLSSGRMGNRLFHYHFLRQISRKTGIDYFHKRFPESAYFEDMGKKAKLFWPLKKTIRLTSKEVLTFTPDDFLTYIMEETTKGKDIVFDPPILGEVFFDYLFFNPNEFLKIKPQYRKEFPFVSANKKVIGIHFRGTDFPKWNEHAALKLPYYKTAIEFCLNEFRNDNPVFVLFTDDKKYPAYLETIAFLRSLGGNFYLGETDNLPIYDFYKMSQCDVVISSPSTFAILAGCIGKPKKIIHDKSWLDYAVNRNDIFWLKLSRTSNPYYSLWKTF
jgi:hypothetical protein